MALDPAYALGQSEYNPFLFAVIGDDEVGLPLTVLSALTRLGLDPWQEAARLSDLPRDVAARALAETIAGLPRDDCQPPGSQALAARLVSALPAHSAAAIPAVNAERVAAGGAGAADPTARRATAWLAWGGLVLAAMLLLFYLQADNRLEPAAPAAPRTGQSSP